MAILQPDIPRTHPLDCDWAAEMGAGRPEGTPEIWLHCCCVVGFGFFVLFVWLVFVVVLFCLFLNHVV